MDNDISNNQNSINDSKPKTKLKDLSEDDINTITEFVSDTAYNLLLSKVSSKQILDVDIKTEISYDESNRELNVDIALDIDFDKLYGGDEEITTNLTNEILNLTHESLDNYLDNNFRE
ncbi:MAG: DUF3194 domain-containing protein [Methanobacteriaceae archaeon]